MIPFALGIWIAAAMGQGASPESEWLKSVPADVPVVVRVRSLGDAGGDLRAMLRTMSPSAAEALKDVLDDGLQASREVLGEAASEAPCLVLFRLPDPDRPAVPPWGVIVKSSGYEGTFKHLASDEAGKPTSHGDHDSFAGKDGRTWYATRGAGWVAFGPDEAMIKAIRKPEASLDGILGAEARAKLLGGDVSAYLNIAAIHKQHGATIQKQLKAALVDQMKQDNAPGPGLAQSLKAADTLFAGLEQALKGGDVLVIGLDFDASGLTLSGWAQPRGAPRGDGEAAKAEVRAGTLVESLPDDLAVYFFSASSPEGSLNASKAATVREGFRGLLATPEQKATAARTKALQGRMVTGFSLMPLRAVSLADPTDPAAAAAASREATRLHRPDRRMETVLGSDTLDHAGFRLDRTKTLLTRWMVEQIQKEKPNVPNMAGFFEEVVPGLRYDAYSGTDGKLFLSMMLTSGGDAKAEIDVAKDGRGNLGRLAAWKSLRAKFPKEMTAFVAISGQETARTIMKGSGVFAAGAPSKPAADMPRGPAFLGIGIVASTKGYDFRLVVPSEVVAVFEKGLAPLWAGP